MFNNTRIAEGKDMEGVGKSIIHVEKSGLSVNELGRCFSCAIHSGAFHSC